MVPFTLSQSIYEFAKSHAIRAMCASVVYVRMCQSAKRVPTSNFLRANVPINVLTLQRCASYSTWCAKIPKANQFFNFVCQKAYQFFNYFSKEFFKFWVFQLCSTFANFKNIWAILENLSSETKNLNFNICKISLRKNLDLDPSNTFDVVFNGACGINRTIIRLV